MPQGNQDIRSTLGAMMEKHLQFHAKLVSEITDGVTVLDPKNTSVIILNTGDSTPADQACGLGYPDFENNVSPDTYQPTFLTIMAGSLSTCILDPSVVGSAPIVMPGGGTQYELDIWAIVHLMFNPNPDEDGAWVIVAGTGTES